MMGALSLPRCRWVLNACSISSVNFTYALRLESLTGFRSYMPLIKRPPFTTSGGKAKFFFPVRHHDHASEVAAGRMARDVDAVWIAAEACGVFINPGHSSAHLVGHRHEIPVRLFHRDEVDGDVVRSRHHEHLGR